MFLSIKDIPLKISENLQVTIKYQLPLQISKKLAFKEKLIPWDLISKHKQLIIDALPSDLNKLFDSIVSLPTEAQNRALVEELRDCGYHIIQV